MRAVIVGAGRVGCGFAADVLTRSGYDVTVVGRGATISRLRRHRGFWFVRAEGGDTATDHWIPLAGAVDTHDAEAVAHAIAHADVVCTAVGAGNLEGASAVVAEGLSRSTGPTMVIGLENLEDAGAVLYGGVRAHIGAEADRHGFSGAVVDRVVAQRVVPEDENHPVTFIGEPGDECVVDAAALTARVAGAPIVGMLPVDDFTAYYRRKLYRYSAGHAAAAYLGRLKGYRFLHAAIRDPEVRRVVTRVMKEGRRALADRYGGDVAGHKKDIRRIVERFGNAALGDTVDRVGRDVPRKVSGGDRLVGPARWALDAGVEPDGLVAAIAAALFSHSVVQSHNEARARTAVMTGLPPDHELVALIAEEWTALSAGGAGLLLSLPDQLWAWTADTYVEESH